MHSRLFVPSDPVGFIDSGIGGASVAEAFNRLLPHEDIIYIADNAKCPYGNKLPEQIIKCVEGNIDYLLSYGCKMIVIACNTATAAAIDHVRAKWKDVPIVGMEPAVKPALLKTKTKVVGVLATQGTFNGRLYRETCARFSKDTTVLACVADEFVQLVEDWNIEGGEVEAVVRKKVEPLLAAGVDYLVLGCTHFPFLKPVIERIAAGRAKIIEPSVAVAKQAKRILDARGLLNPMQDKAQVLFCQTNPRHKYKKLPLQNPE